VLTYEAGLEADLCSKLEPLASLAELYKILVGFGPTRIFSITLSVFASITLITCEPVHNTYILPFFSLNAIASGLLPTLVFL